jgi:hypothetical protein
MRPGGKSNGESPFFETPNLSFEGRFRNVAERRPGHEGRRGDRFRVPYAYPERTTGRSACSVATDPTRNRKRPTWALRGLAPTNPARDRLDGRIEPAIPLTSRLYLKRHRAARVILAHTWRVHRSPGRAARRTGSGRARAAPSVRVESASDSERASAGGARAGLRNRGGVRGRRDSRTIYAECPAKPAPIPRSCSAPGARGQTVNGRKR